MFSSQTLVLVLSGFDCILTVKNIIQMARLRNEEMPNAEVDLHEIFSTSRPENYYLNGKNKGISGVLINFLRIAGF